LDSK
jgi:hypothetical protein